MSCEVHGQKRYNLGYDVARAGVKTFRRTPVAPPLRILAFPNVRLHPALHLDAFYRAPRNTRVRGSQCAYRRQLPSPLEPSNRSNNVLLHSRVQAAVAWTWPLAGWASFAHVRRQHHHSPKKTIVQWVDRARSIQVWQGRMAAVCRATPSHGRTARNTGQAGSRRL